MRVVYVATTARGGAGMGMLRYHRALLGIGVDSRILTADCTGFDGEIGCQSVSLPRRSIVLRMLRRLTARLTAEHSIRTEFVQSVGEKQGRFELYTFPFSPYRIERHPLLRSCDVVNLHWNSGSVDWSNFFRAIDVPVAITLHDQNHYMGGFHYEGDRERNPHLAHVDRRIVDIKQRSLVKSRVIAIANSDWNMQRARLIGFFSESTPIFSVLYPIDTTVFRPLDMDRGIFRKLNDIDQDKIVVGFASENLHNPRKGFDLLMDSIRLLPSNVKESIHLLSFGNAPSDEIRSQIPVGWTHLGYLSSDTAKVDAYNQMDIFVAPSREEAFGQTAVEAAACGAGVLVTPAGGLVEAVGYGDYGTIASECSARAISDRLSVLILRYLNDRHNVRRFQHSSIVERHSPCNQGKAYLKALQFFSS